MKVHLKLPERLLDSITAYLRRPHSVALERVGFVACVGGNTSDGIVLLARTFHPVRDEDYEADELVGARISSGAVQRALALAYAQSQSMLFVHEHRHKGKPHPSRVDLDCWSELIPNFWHVRPELPHGALILSEDNAMGIVWVPHQTDVSPVSKFTVVGGTYGGGRRICMSDHQSRQSFLGEDSDEFLKGTTAGVIGLSGGGSHVCQQLAHIGVGNYVIVDPQAIEDSNLNRLIGGTAADVAASTTKVDIASRVIRGVRPDAHIDAYEDDWRNVAGSLRNCDVVFGCVDSYKERNELERQVRRHLTPYIDIGMDVAGAGSAYHISGQAVLSIPGGACLWCMGVLREQLLAEEFADYGNAGIRQQVVWPNGVLASSAVGLFMSLIVPWAPKLMPLLLEYDGNLGTVAPSRKLEYMPKTCLHFEAETDLGDPFWKITGESGYGSK